MSAACYILYSVSLDKYYIGATAHDIDIRIIKHNSSFYGTSKYTSKTNDWELFLVIETLDYSHALRIEAKIKKMKSKIYILNLNKYEEMRILLYNKTLHRRE